jgi:hypothetical protein
VSGQPSNFVERADHVLGSASEDWLNELFLMNHYTAFTADSLSSNPTFQKIWRVEIPKQALTHRFLMHGIIGVAALHLAHLYPSRSSANVLLYKRHQRLALTAMHRLLLDISQENCNAVFPCSSLASIFSLYEFANDLDARTQDFTSTCDRIFQIFAVTRGVREVLTPTYIWIRDGPLQALLDGHWNHPDSDFQLPEPALSQLNNMKAFVLANCQMETQQLALENAFDELIAIYAEVSFTFKSGLTIEAGNILKYIAAVPSEFIAMLQRGDDNALIMFAYFIILTGAAQRRWFCNETLGYSGLRMVRQVLNPNLHSWLDWPTEQHKIGLTALRHGPVKRETLEPSPNSQGSPRAKGRSPLEMSLLQNGYIDPALSATSPLPEDPRSHGPTTGFSSPA